MKKKARTIVTWALAAVCAVCFVGPLQQLEAEAETTTYSYVYFGSYPQTEIVKDAVESGVYGKNWEEEGDYMVNWTLYSYLEEASYDANGDTTINGKKYHRVTGNDATVSSSGGEYYSWADKTTYHYFRYDPIKWRVLYNSDNEAFLLSEIALDAQKFDSSGSYPWEKSSIRSWLNDTFMNRAFTAGEQEGIKSTSLGNGGSLSSETGEGETTVDKVFLLSKSEVYTDNAVKYGFSSQTDSDTARQCKSSTYAKAMGAYSDISSSYRGNCVWWLRSPGYTDTEAVVIARDGAVEGFGRSVETGSISVRPALYLDLEKYNPGIITGSSISVDKAEYVYTAKAIEPDVTVQLGGKTLQKGTDYTVSYSDNINVGTASVTVTGTGNYGGTASKTFTITEYGLSDENVTLGYGQQTYDGTARTPAVLVFYGDIKLDSGTDYTVEYSDNINAGTATVKVTGQGNYKDEVVKTFNIAKADLSDAELSLSQIGYTWDGKAKEPAVTVKLGQKELQAEDYTVTYIDNVDAGTASVKVTGKGN